MLRYGWNTTCYQVINPGISHWFAARGDALVGYVRHAGVRVVAGAPVAPAHRLAAVVAEFEGEAHHAGDLVCYFGAEERLEALVRSRRTHASITLGAQPTWHPSGLEHVLTGHRSLRAQLHRAENKGVIVSRWSPHHARDRRELRQVLLAWLATRGLPPLRFLVEPETLGNLEDRRVFVAQRGGRVIGFLVASPVPARRGWLVEQMIRAPEAPNGVAELMLHSATEAMSEEGADFVTLGLAPLSRRAGQEVKAPWWLRGVLGWVRAHGRRFYNFDGLDAFKAKFLPETWAPVYAIGNQSRFSPRMLYAIAAAFSGGSPLWTVARAAGRALRQELAWLHAPPATSGAAAGRAGG